MTKVWLLGFVLLAAVIGCQSPEAFRSGEDAGPPGSGTGGKGMGKGGEGGEGGEGGMIAASGGAPGSGGATGSGGVAGTGGAAGGAGGGATTGSGGATTGSGGATSGSGGATGGSAGGTGGVPGSGGSAMGGAAGAGTGGQGGDMGGRGGATSGSGGATGGRGGGGGGGSTPKIVSIDFGVGGMGAPAMTSTEVAGVKAVAHWNSAVAASGTLSTTLTFSDGTAVSGAMVTWMAPSAPSPSTGLYSVGLTNATGDAHMMNGYLDPSMSSAYTATITVSGLPAPLTTGGYDVYVYYMAQLNSGVTRKHKIAIGSKSFTVSQTGPSPTTFSKHAMTLDGGTTGDYVLFTNVSGAGFTLTSAAVSASDNFMRAPVNGIQIVWPSGS